MSNPLRAAQAHIPEAAEAANEQRYAVVRAEGCVTPFALDDFYIRIVVIDGEAWFVGKDVAGALGYSNETDAMTRHCKGVVKRYPLRTSGGVQDVRILAEPDMLRLIVNSKLPSAERFERWVFEEVLPTIRKTGSYAMAQAPAPVLPGSYIEALEHLLASKKAEQFAIEQRDEAVRTKALIGSRREAQAMATASAAAREAKKLRAKLGEGAMFASILAVNKAFTLKLDDRKAWRPLKKWCEDHGVKPLDAIDTRWGKVERWPAGAWLDVYGIDLADKFGAEEA
ncbi:BRO-N domain-containing protein [Xenophilus azovorans]|uniref:BRO-N domain-containing protein n=1 Tax=Xenophilus azovorans TaxID=151755 RepID=UPI000690655E|nr:Bro-N domain-containing protein [Xenophilus azovorans]